MKKFFAILLMICTIFSFNMVTKAQDDTQKTVEYIAQNWIDVQFSGEAEVSQIVVLFNSEGQFIGHLVSFEKNNVPAGYIVLSHEEQGHPIIEYALEGESIYNYLKDQFAANRSRIVAERQSLTESNNVSSFSIFEDVLYTDFINYSLKIEYDNEIMLYNQYNQVQTFSKTINISEIAPSSDTFYDDYITLPTDEGSKQFVNIPGANEIHALVMGEMPGVIEGEGNCGPTSLANTIKLYAEFKLNNNSSALTDLKLNDSDDDTYKELVKISGYTCASPASMSTLVSSIKTYATQQGYSCSTDDYRYDYWSDFTRDINAHKPILLYTSSKAGTAHSQVVVGHRMYDNGAKYLRILSGWTCYPTFVKFKPSSLNNFNGYCVSIWK